MALGEDIEAGEGLLILASVIVIGYFLYKGLKSIPNPFGAGGSLADAAYNAATGELSCAQIEAAAQQEAQQIVKASGGAISMVDALKQARADQTALHNMQVNCGYSVGTNVFCCMFYTGQGG